MVVEKMGVTLGVAVRELGVYMWSTGSDSGQVRFLSVGKTRIFVLKLIAKEQYKFALQSLYHITSFSICCYGALFFLYYKK